MAKPLRVLIVEDSENDALLLLNALKEGGYEPTFERVDTSEGLKSALSQKEWDCIISDYSMPQFNGLAALQEIREHDTDIPFILISGTIGEEIAVQAMKAGAQDYIMKDRLARLIPALEREMAEAAVRRKQRQAEEALRAEETRYHTLFEQSPDGVVIIDSQTRLPIMFNDIAARQLGYSREEFARLHINDFEAAETPEATKARIEKILRIGRDDFETKHRTRTGDIRNVLVTVKTVELSGKPVFHCIFRDITERKRSEETIRQLLHQNELILNSAGEGIYGTDLDGRATFINPSTARMLGWEIKELVGKPMHAMIHHTRLDGSPYPIEECPIYAAFKDGLARRVNDEIFWRKDGTSFPVEYLSNPIRDEQGNPQGAVVTFLDITERKQAEQARLAVTLRNEALVKALGQIVYEYGSQSDKVIWQGAYTRTLGYTQEEIGNNMDSWTARIHPEDLGKALKEVENAISEQRTYNLDYRFRHRDGSYKWMHDSGVILTNAAGELERIIGVFSDITERKQTEELLLQRDAYLTAIIENQPGLMWLKDTEGRYLAVNHTYAISCGRQDAEDVVGKTDLDVWPRDLAEKYRADDTKVIETGLSIVVEEPGYEKGELKWYETFKTPVKDAQGNVIGTTGYAHDITERRRAEQMLLQAQKVEAIGQLAGGVAHDFNNILMAITGYCELLMLQTEAEDPLQRSVLEIQKAANQGASLTRQLLAFSRKQILEPSVLNLNDEIKKMESMLRRLVRENIELTLNLSGDLGLVKADVGQIQQVIMNLVINSGDAMPTGGTLRIETYNVTFSQGLATESGILQPGEYITISVKDSGTGMDDATRSRIFEPFFTTKEQGKGTGLGLSTVFGIVKQSEGHITVESAPGQGTTFTIYLPRLEEGEESATISDSAASAAPLPRGSESILLVDDNDSIRTAVAALLEMCGYRVLQAASGQEGLETSLEHADGIDLVITDVVMPKMGGPELVKQLVANRPGIKVIYMSGYSEEAAALQSNLNHNSAYLQKPAPMLRLLQTMRDLLDAKSTK